MDITTRSWLRSELGADTDLVDLDTRLVRLGTARRVAIEILKERKAKMVGSPLVLGVASVMNVSYTGNIAALERQIAALEAPDAPPAPGEPGYGESCIPNEGLNLIQLRGRPRR